MVFGVFRASRNNPHEESSGGILDIQLKCFLYGAILPNENIRSSPWKLRMFNLYSVCSLLMYVPSVSAQCYALYLESENITELTDTFFTIIAALLHCSISSYLLTQRKALEHLVLKTNEAFAEFTSKLPLETKHTLIMSDAKKKIRQYTLIFIISIVITGFLWLAIPNIFWHIHNAKEKDGEDKIHWEHLSYRMWLPPGALEHPTYHFIYTYQVVLIINLLTDNIGYNSMYYALTIYTAAHFKVLATLLEDIDQYITSSDNTKSSEQNGIRSFLDGGTGFATDMLSKLSGQDETDSNRKKNSQLEEYHSLDPRHITSIPIAEDYLVNCVKYHQALLQYVEDVDAIFGTLLFIFFSLNGVMMCLAVVLSTLGKGSTGSIKFMSGVITVWIPTFLICWFGEHLTDE
ncbi:hypothetical protein L798_06523, partial [Zootermopsis nevadensis]